MGRVLLAGIDTLAVGFDVEGYALTSEDWAALADAKANAQGSMFDSGGSPIVFQGHKFSVSPKGSHGYEYLLQNNDMTIQIAERATGGSAYPEVRVTWRSEYLWRHGWRGTYAYVASWIRHWALGSVEKVSRADLCIDVAMPLPEVNLRAGECVSHARNKTEFHVQRHLKGMDETGFVFGQGDLLCRVYDKRAEIKVSHKDWFMEMWRKNGWNGTDPVTRVEFQVRRDHLKEQQIETVQDLENQLADLWMYFSQEWLSIRDENEGDSNHRRWPVKEFWSVVRDSVAAFGTVTGVRRLSQRQPRLDALKKLCRGSMVSIVAMCRTTYETSPGHSIGVQAAIGLLQGEMIREWVGDPAFVDDVNKRAAKLAAMT